MIKIAALGFFFGKHAYLKDAWNILDFVIVISGFLPYLLSGGGGGNITALRSFRVLRPLRTISGVEGLRVIVSSLITSMPLLRDTMLVIFFFFVIFSIAGVQLFQGVLKQRCVSIESGKPEDFMCGGAQACGPEYFCGKTNMNPNNGVTSFDNTMKALLIVLQTVTMQGGWNFVYTSVMKTVGYWVIVYFIPIIFIGANFLTNLTIAVIKSKYTEEIKNKKAGKRARKRNRVRKGGDSDDETAHHHHHHNKDESQYDGPMTKDQQKAFKEKKRIEEMLKKLDITLK